MSKQKTNHIVMVRDENGLVLGLNKQTGEYTYHTESASKTFEALDAGGRCMLATRSVFEWIDRETDYAKEVYTPIIFG